MIEGMIQGVKYESSDHRLYFRLRADGKDSEPSVGNDAYVIIYNPSGNEVLASAAMTQVGTTAVFYYDLDASATGTFPLGMGYRCHIAWNDGTLVREDWATIDVVKWPWNEPLVTTEEIDDMKPGWAGKKPGAWTDWTQAIEAAHLRLAKDLRLLRDDQGNPIYPHRIFYRSEIRSAEIAYVFREIAISGMAVEDDERRMCIEDALDVIPTLLVVDHDDDNVDDGEDEETAQAISLVH